MGQIRVNSAGPDNSTVTICLSGDIDATSAEQLRSVLVATIMRQRPATIVVDLQHATALDESVIGTLRAAQLAADDVRLSLIFADSGTTAPDQPGLRTASPSANGHGPSADQHE